MIEIALCDDDIFFIEYEKKVIEEFFKKNNIKCNVNIFLSGEGLLKSENLEVLDLVFLDMDMPNMKGIKVAEEIRKNNYNIEIVFVTIMIDLVFSGYKVHAFRYILKKINMDYSFEFEECLNTFVKEKRIKETKIEYQFLEGKKEIYTSCIIDIEYINRKNRFKILEKGEIHHYNLKCKMSDLEYLKKYDIYRVHKGFMVNFNFVDSISRYKLHLKDKLGIIDIGQPRYDMVNDIFLNYRGNKI